MRASYRAKALSFAVGLGWCLSFAGCSKTAAPLTSREEVTAPPKITDSFVVEKSDVGKVTLSLAKSSLEKEFLLQVNVIEQEIVPLGRSLKSRVVAFRQRDGKVHMLETNQGHVINGDLPKTLLLASFPIIKDTADRVQFDFNAGISKVFNAGDMVSFAGGQPSYNSHSGAFDVQESYLDNVKVTADNQLEIHQIAQKTIQSGYPTVEVRYYLSAYQPDPTYVPFSPPDVDDMGFFATHPLLQADGTTKVYSTRFAPDKEIVFAISSNTPPEYREAVRDAILYWNGVLPKPLIKVIDAPNGVSAPTMSYNLIQWVNYDQATFAYANVQADPRTGQILHAQVYMTSNFAFDGRQKARRMLRQAKAKPSPSKKELGISGFEAEELCHKDHDHLVNSLPGIMGATREQMLRVSQDYVRSSVAHEVGHALGLRHNFAASFDSKNYPLSSRGNIFREYLDKGTLPHGVQMLNSVMDYPYFHDDVLMGRLIYQQVRQSREDIDPLAYDAWALRVLYADDRSDPSGHKPFYCTDSEVDGQVGCRKFDAGRSMAEEAAQITSEKLAGLSSSIIETFLAERSPLPGFEATPVNAVDLKPKAAHTEIYVTRNLFVGSLTNTRPTLKLLREFPYFGMLNEKEVEDRRRDIYFEEIREAGGLAKILPFVPRTYFTEVNEQIATMLESEAYLHGMGDGERTYELSSTEREVIRKTSTAFLKKFEELHVEEDIDAINRLPKDWKREFNDVGNDIVYLSSQRMQEYLFAVDPETLNVRVEDEKENLAARDLKIPQFHYRTSDREKAAKLLDPHEDLGWGTCEKESLRNTLKAQLDAACNCDFEKLKSGTTTVVPLDKQRDVRRWITVNQGLLRSMK